MYRATFRIGLARSPVSSGGKPGTWMKYYNGAFSEPGIRGQSTGIGAGNLTGTAVNRVSVLAGALVAVGGGSPTMSFSPDGLSWYKMTMPLVYQEEFQWNRTIAKWDLVAYPTLVSEVGGDLNSEFYLYYTYLEPRDTFDHRYLSRKRVLLNVSAASLNNDHFTAPVLGAIALWYSEANNDTWATAAMVAPSSGYTLKDWTAAYLPTAKMEEQSVRVYECYKNSTQDHFLTLQQDNCTRQSQMLRVAGWSWLSKPLGNKIPGMVAVVMMTCYNAEKLDHSISVGRQCEEQMGYQGVETIGFVLALNGNL